MKDRITIEIMLDKRREKLNGKYPVRLYVLSPSLNRKERYPTTFEYTEKEFHSIWQTERPRKIYNDARKELDALKTHANETADSITPFNFDTFERKLQLKKGESGNVVYQYDLIIEKLKSDKSFSTAGNYQVSKKSLLDFIEHAKGSRPTHIAFSEITADWLQEYENYMVKTLGRSLTTVSMYLRALRTVFNNAISTKEIDRETYPFGKRLYQVPSVRNVKKSLTKEDLKKLFDSVPITPEQIRAKDYFFFSFACNGMNFKDIALLKFMDIKGDKIVFYRAKTLKTSKKDLRPITIYLNDVSKAFIAKYGNKAEEDPNGYLFPILSPELSDYDNHRAIKNFTIGINKAIKKLALKLGITGDISTYWARHSFSSNAIRSGASMEFVMESLGHADMKTTIGYFAGFEEEDKREFMQKMMDFNTPVKPNTQSHSPEKVNSKS